MQVFTRSTSASSGRTASELGTTGQEKARRVMVERTVKVHLLGESRKLGTGFKRGVRGFGGRNVTIGPLSVEVEVGRLHDFAELRHRVTERRVSDQEAAGGTSDTGQCRAGASTSKEGVRGGHRSLGLQKRAHEEVKMQARSLVAITSEVGAWIKCKKAAGLEMTRVTCNLCKVWFLYRKCGEIRVRVGAGDKEASADCMHMKVLNANKKICFDLMQIE